MKRKLPPRKSKRIVHLSHVHRTGDAETGLLTSVLELVVAFGLLILGQLMEGIPGLLVQLTALVLHLIGFMHLSDYLCDVICRKYGYHRDTVHKTLRFLIIVYFLFLIYMIAKPAA